MQTAKRIKPIRSIFLYFLIGMSKVSYFAQISYCDVHSQEISLSEQNSTLSCGVLENFGGNVEILDASRTHLVNAALKSTIPCGSWVSVNRGWAQIRHRNGPHIHLGSQTFIHFPSDDEQSRAYPDDHLILYRGQVYIQAGGGEGEFRIVSAAARARVKRGKIIFIYNHQENESQLIALENSAVLENRFQPNRKVIIQAGEATELNFKLERVVPALPKVVSIAALKPKLFHLRVPDSDQYDAIRAAIRRQSRKFASSFLEDSIHANSSSEDIKENKEINNKNGTHISRKPANENSHPKNLNYSRHQSDENDSELKTHFFKRLGGDEIVGERILFPDKYYGRVQPVQIETEDPAEKMSQKKKAQEDLEKKHLIEELSQIKVGE